jgi:hypothetical protein
LIGEKFANRHTSIEVNLRRFGGALRDCLCADAPLTEAGKDFCDLLALNLEHQHIARPARKLRDSQRLLRPGQLFAHNT